MHKFAKKGLALVLALLMALSTVSGLAFAEGPDTETAGESAGTEETEIHVNETGIISKQSSDGKPGGLTAVYLSGSGDDENDGSCEESPVATFDAAKERLAPGGVIYITDTVTVNGRETWDLPEAEYGKAEVTLSRDPGTSMVFIGREGSLTLGEITIDGNSEFATGDTVSVSRALFDVEGTLTLGADSIIQFVDSRSSDPDGSSAGSAAAVYVGETGTLTAGGGQILDVTGDVPAVYVENAIEIKDACTLGSVTMGDSAAAAVETELTLWAGDEADAQEVTELTPGARYPDLSAEDADENSGVKTFSSEISGADPGSVPTNRTWAETGLFTSDIHDSQSKLYTLWNVIEAAGLEHIPTVMAIGGDYPTNGTSNDGYMTNSMYQDLETFGDASGLHMVYTTGNHEYKMSDSDFLNLTSYERVGLAYESENYSVITFGASYKSSDGYYFYNNDIEELADLLAEYDKGQPIFVISHYPLHYYNSRRTVANSDKVIEVLNEYPNVIFCWGHNHTENDPEYGTVYAAGSTLYWAAPNSSSSQTKPYEINFTYANLGAILNAPNDAAAVLFDLYDGDGIESDWSIDFTFSSFSKLSGTTYTISYKGTDDGGPAAADKSVLAALIEEAKGEDETRYTEDSWAAMQAALIEAEAVYADDDADQDTVDKAAAALSAAIAGLVEKEEEPEPEPVDKSVLAAMIEEAKGEDETRYTEDSWSALQAALDDAEAVYADDDADQDSVDKAAAALSAAIAGLVEKEEEPEPEPADKSALAAAIEEARGEDESRYTDDSRAALQTALTAAEAVYADDDADQTAVDEAAAALMSAIAGLVPAATDDEKAALSGETAEAENLAGGNYTADSLAALLDAVSAAEEVLAKGGNASEADVSAAAAALQAAMDALVPAATDSEKEALSEEITEAERLLGGSYTADSLDALQQAVDAANAVLAEGSNASEADVATAAADIRAAVDALIIWEPFTGFKQNDQDGGWYYYIDSEIAHGLNDILEGAVNGQDGWWYVTDGKVDFSYTGVSNFSNAYGWWYIKGGQVDFSRTGIEPNSFGWWRIVGGKVDFSCNSVEQNDYGWWYVTGGKVDFSRTGIEPNSYGWWRIVNGKVDFSCNSVEQNDYGWWYIIGGQVQFGYTGVADYANAYGWWYIKNGQVDFGRTGIEPNSYGWWRVVSGKVDFGCNSVEQNDYGWWYLLGGQVQFGYTGVADYANAYGWWYVSAGKVDFGYTGSASNHYGTWYVVNGKVDFSRS